MASWLTPQASQQIQQGIADLGQAFRPPSISEMYMAAKMKADQAGAAQKEAGQAAIGKIYGPSVVPFFQAGVSDPVGQYTKADIYQRATQPGATPQSLDAPSYALHGNAQQTFAGMQMQQQNDLTKTAMTPLSIGQTRFVPPSVQTGLGLPAIQQGAVSVGSDDYTYLPGANGAIDRKNPLEGPEGDKTLPKPVNLGQDAFGNPIMGTVQKGPNGQAIGVPLPIQGRDSIASVLQPGATPAAPASPFGGLPAAGGAVPNSAALMDPNAQRLQASAQVLGVDPVAMATKSGKDLMDYLEQAAPDKAAHVRSILEGRASFPEGFFLKTPYGQALTSLVTRIDPNFDASNFKNRALVQKEFMGGGPSSPAAQISFGNAALQHLGRMYEVVDKLDNFEGLGPVNRLANVVRNAGKVASGTSAAIQAFRVSRQNAVDEVSKFYSSAGGSAEERKARVEQISEAGSPAELRAAIREQVHDIFAKVNALQDRWHAGVGNIVPDFPVIQPKARPALEAMGFIPPQNANAASRAQVVAPGSPQAAGPSGAPASAEPVQVKTPDEAMKLAPGTPFITPDGRKKIR